MRSCRPVLVVAAIDPDLAITINRSDLEQVMMGNKSFLAQIEDGTAQTEGNLDVLAQLASTMVEFDLFFEILPGTSRPSSVDGMNPFEVGEIHTAHE